MKSFRRSVACVFLTLVLSVGIVKGGLVDQPTCPLNIGRNQVLNLDQSEASVLGGYHKETLEDCVAGCCQQEWKQEDMDMRGHCNLVTFYQHEDESVMNCFMVQCATCFFSHQDDFSFAWVHRPLHPDNDNHLAFKELNSFPSHNALPSSLSLDQIKQSSYFSMESSKLTSLLDVIRNAINWSREAVTSSVERVRRSVSRRENASKAKVEPAVEKDIATPAPSSSSKTEPAASESQPSPASTPKPSKDLQTSVKVSESASSTTTTKPVDTVIVDDTVTGTADEKESASPETNPVVTPEGQISVVTTQSTDDQKVSSTTDKKVQSTTETLSEEAKSSTTSKPSAQTESTPQSESTTKPKSTPETVSTTKVVTTPASESTPKPESTAKTESTPKLESSSKTGSTTKSVATTPKLESSSTSETSPSQRSSTQTSLAVSSSPDKVSTLKPETTPKQEPVSQEKTTSAKQESTSKSQPEKVPSEVPSGSLTETQTRSPTVAFMTEEMVTSTLASAGSKDAAVFTFETNNFVLILSLVLGVILVVVVAVVLGKRWYEAYQRRHYNKVDYLINGMYT